MDRKNLSSFEIKDAALGQVSAVFATLNVKDKDNDLTVQGAFQNGAPCVISAYGHKSWEGALPVGKGVIREIGNQAICDMQFFMNTAAGRDTFEAVKELGSLQQFSYGYDVLESEPGEHEGKSVRVLKKMKVHEVSPVMVGAGENTRVLSAKSAPTLNEQISFAVATVRDAVESAQRVAALRAEQGKGLSQVNRQSLVELDACTTDLRSLLTVENETKTADDAEITKIYLSFVAANLESDMQ